jgi:hypothetical protein
VKRGGEGNQFGEDSQADPGEGENTWRTTTGMKKMMSMKTGEKKPAKRMMKKQ